MGTDCSFHLERKEAGKWRPLRLAPVDQATLAGWLENRDYTLESAGKPRVGTTGSHHPPRPRTSPAKME